MSIIDKIKSFLNEVYVELKKTRWLSRKEVLRYTVIILVVSVLVAAFLGGLDYVFSEILRRFVF